MTTGGLSNITVRDCVLNGTSAGFRIKSYVGGGGVVKDITWENVSMHDVATPIEVSQNYGGEHPPCAKSCNATLRPRYEGLSMRGVRVSGSVKADGALQLDGSTSASGVSIQLSLEDCSLGGSAPTSAMWACAHAAVAVQGKVTPPVPAACTHTHNGS